MNKKNGKIVSHIDNSIRYYKDGKYHREDGPAIIIHGLTKCWLINDQYHRLDGPAVEDDDGYIEYYVNGNYCFSKEEFEEQVRLYKLKVFW